MCYPDKLLPSLLRRRVVRSSKDRLMNCCPHCEDARDFFNRKTARRDLRRYQKKGPSKTTGLLLEALRAQGVGDRTLLDVGGGIGAVQHELFREGLRHATQVDASPAYLETSQGEAGRQLLAHGHPARGDAQRGQRQADRRRRPRFDGRRPEAARHSEAGLEPDQQHEGEAPKAVFAVGVI